MARQPSKIPAATDARAAGTARKLNPRKEEPQNLENQESGPSSKDVLVASASNRLRLRLQSRRMWRCGGRPAPCGLPLGKCA